MLSAMKSHNGLAPEELPKSIRYLLDVSATISIEFDLAEEQDQLQIAFVQSIWVDNSQSARRLDILIQGSAQPLKIPAGAIACLPISHGGHFRCTFSVSAIQATPIPIIFFNVPMAPIVYVPGAV